HAGEFAVVHVHGVFTYPCTVACRMAEQNHVPYIVRPLGGLSGYSLSRHALRKSFYLAAWERHNLNHAAALHFTAPAEAAEARGLGLRSPSIVVPLGVAAPAPVGDAEVAAFRERYRTAGRLSLLFLGRLDPKKGLELLFRVLAESADRLPPWRLLVAGSGTPAYAESLQQVVVRAGLGSRVEFVGEIQGREKWTAFRASDLFLLTSRHENFAVAAAEAMRCGVPVIVSNQVGIAPYVEEQRCGLSVSLDSSELAAAIQCLAVDPGLRREMGANGRELASRMFDWPLIAQKLIGIYKELRPQPHS
ncbi:MAG: glycosyltransferase, partial [Acidobacteria bacterium]|nr:glycosyltransferase [Acidobacteriota bacterium]